MVKPKKRKSASIDITIPVMIICGLGAAFFACYATYGLYVNDVFVPGKFNGLRFHGLAAWFIAGAYYCLAAIFSSVLLARFFGHHKSGFWMSTAGRGDFAVPSR
jgi:hypothetical protein